MADPAIDPLAIIELTNLKASGKLEHLAKHPQLGMKPEWIGELSRDKYRYVRTALARNPAIADFPEVVKKLSKDRSKSVRYTLAQNPALATSPDIIQALSTDKDWSVRKALAQNPAIPTRTARTNSWQATQPVTQTTTI